ncbi:MAG TPA: hypothetical protein PKZ12_07105, partial [Smithellaceae bacterium]|nr:hypothetical protein [Smithellaceae bacterium]
MSDFKNEGISEMTSLFRLNLMFPYAIPPLTTFLICLFLATLTFQAGRTKRVNQLFTIFCILQAMVNLEILLNSIVASPDIALAISRFDHLFYVFVIPVGIHFVLEATGFEYRKIFIRSLYGFSLVMVPFTQTDYYYPGNYGYFFGFFPKGGPAFMVFGLVGLFATLYTSYVLLRVLKQS